MNSPHPLPPQETPRIKRPIPYKDPFLLTIVTILLMLLFVIQLAKSIQMLNPFYYEFLYEIDWLHVMLPTFLTFMLLLFVLIVNALFHYIGTLTSEVEFLKRTVSELIEQEKQIK